MMPKPHGPEGSMAASIEAEVDRNFDFFQSIVQSLIPARAGQYALLRDQAVVDFFGSAGAAVRAGYEQFKDRRFSIQPVAVEPVDLGFFSHVADIGAGPRS
jgi:hypothetical protein